MDDPSVARVGPHLLGRFQTTPCARVTTAARGEAEARLAASFAMHEGEMGFVRALLHGKKNVWVFRANQRGFCGDFLLVDMSVARVDRRPVFAVELKLGGALVRGGGGAGVQFSRVRGAVEDLARRFSIIAPSNAVILLAGDPREVLRALGIEAGRS
jgi:hypothetical protein